MKTVRLLVSGRVQGVFFRANVRQKALQLRVNGYAKNLHDGNVEVVAEGEESRINELLDFIKKGPGSAEVSDVQISNLPAQDFKAFEIRH